MTILSEKKHTARIQHRCCLCTLPINVGEIYKIQTITDSGEFWTFKMHPDCHYLMDKLFDSYELEEGVGDESFFDRISDKWCDITETKDRLRHPSMKEMLELVLNFYKEKEQ